MANLVICCDGTWNNPEQEDNGIPAPTNVIKIFYALAEKDDSNVDQQKYYHPGLGGEDSGLKDAVIDGALGKNIKRHICSAYFWIAQKYKPGDNIYLFGFSRGAFTVRSLSGLLEKGLLKLEGLSSKESWDRTHKLYELYRNNQQPQHKEHFINNGKPLPIRFIGVWDTVGALGIPNDMEIFNLFDNPAEWRFHSTNLGKHITTARHAMAMDEKRSSFCVTRWSGDLTGRDVKEVWFPGVHSDVGGGYANTDLSDIALDWMIDEATENNLKFRANVKDQLKPDFGGVLHNSFKGIFTKFRSRPRNICEVHKKNEQHFHHSVFDRAELSPITHPPYWNNINLNVGVTKVINVYAKDYWNPSYIYMEKGEKYIFSSTGMWQDSKDTCDWNGTEDGNLTFGDLVRFASSLWGMTETKFRKITQNRSTDFWGTKRIERLPWFIAVGCIANDSASDEAVTNDGSPHPHQYFALPYHKATPFEVKCSGYFYAFANDVWALYGNNHGNIKLSIHRVE